MCFKSEDVLSYSEKFLIFLSLELAKPTPNISFQ